MIDWRQGGWSGSMRRHVDRDVRQHLRTNPTARRARRPIPLRFLHALLGGRGFARFASAYLAVAFAAALVEAVAARACPSCLPAWTLSHVEGGPPSPDIKSLITNVASYLITAQVGVLGVVSIALALVTLIAQRDNSGGDVQVYYHEALAFEVTGSCVALLAVLCAQLTWPLQFLLHRLGEGTPLQFFKLVLLGSHVAWMLLNLASLAHFIGATFRFVQQSARERMREQYTVSVLVPRQMTSRLLDVLLLGANEGLLDARGNEVASVRFGHDFGMPIGTASRRSFMRPVVLHDVRVRLVRWVTRRWAARLIAGIATDGRATPPAWDQPMLIFPVRYGQRLQGTVDWCRRRGGPSLTWLEALVLRMAFRFRRVRDED